MLEYAPMLHVSYYAQSYAGIIRQSLVSSESLLRPVVAHHVGRDGKSAVQ